MLKTGLTLLGFNLLACQMLWADDSIYCPQNHGYISVGMNQAQVLAACGQPMSKENSNVPATRRVPVQQLTFNNAGQQSGSYNMYNLPSSTAFYGYFNIPVGNQGATIQIDIKNNKVSSVSINGSNVNSTSVCQGASIDIGDPVAKVYNACGSPALVNNTYVNEVIPNSALPQIWIYKPTPYQPAIRLTFVNGKLQSIN